MRTKFIPSVAIAALLLLIASLLVSCSDLKTDLPTATLNTLRVHDDGWDNNVASAVFHGKYLKSTTWNQNECKPCHGTTFAGGSSGKSCFTCHPVYPHAAGFENGRTHGTYLYSQNYPLASCRSCHGTTYSGGAIVNVTCMRSGCHVDATNTPRSPEACNTCHGDFSAAANNSLAPAPPKSVTHETATTARGVGAHARHLSSNVIGNAVKCQECHVVPTQVSSPGHLGTLPAEVAFNDQLARLVTGKGSNVPNPTYDPTMLKCRNSYCHGNWIIRKATSATDFVFVDSVMVGLNYSPTWTSGSADAACGSCHGLPPKGHMVLPISTCGSCHFGIVSADGKITDKAKHINGKINVFNQEYSF